MLLSLVNFFICFWIDSSFLKLVFCNSYKARICFPCLTSISSTWAILREGWEVRVEDKVSVSNCWRCISASSIGVEYRLRVDGLLVLVISPASVAGVVGRLLLIGVVGWLLSIGVLGRVLSIGASLSIIFDCCVSLIDDCRLESWPEGDDCWVEEIRTSSSSYSSSSLPVVWRYSSAAGRYSSSLREARRPLLLNEVSLPLPLPLPLRLVDLETTINIKRYFACINF